MLQLTKYSIVTKSTILMGVLFITACGSEYYQSSMPQSLTESTATATKLSANPSPPAGQEIYAPIVENKIIAVANQPVSTFSMDVDTGSYANMRRFIEKGILPPANAIRIEELINYFDYDYLAPTDQGAPFNVATEIAPTPWNPNTHLLHIGVKAYDVAPSIRPAANLVFLVDVSGSMQSQDKLPLLKASLRLLVGKLEARDRISLVTYAGGTKVVLEATPGDQKAEINAALGNLNAAGSTNGGAGIQLAYAEAKKSFIPGAINRVILATDGDLNVGITDFDALIDLVENARDTGITLTTLGFGTGNYNDQLLEQLADSGNGNHAYIDKLSEGRKVLVEEMSSTLLTVAKDVKLQIEFNPALVAEYWLIGYENRVLAPEDFNNDKVDAGEIGAGHSLTALYEIALKGSTGQRLRPLRYATNESDTNAVENFANELAFVGVRYKKPDGDISQLMEFPIAISSIKTAEQKTSADFQFAAAVATFGQILRKSPYIKEMNLSDVGKLAQSAVGDDPHGYRREFIGIVDMLDGLTVVQ